MAIGQQAMKNPVLHTLGYEGATLADFITQLKKAAVATVADVRELPLSRKRGFSKTAFAAALEGAGIGYVHLPALGCPKPIRERYRLDGDWSAYARAFGKHLDASSAAVLGLARLAAESRICLVCFEADFNYCHRSIVAAAAANVSRLQVNHLFATEVTAGAERLSAA